MYPIALVAGVPEWAYSKEKNSVRGREDVESGLAGPTATPAERSGTFPEGIAVESELPLPSLAASSALRFGADVAGLLLGVVAAVITARWLGPVHKGVYSTIVLLLTLVSLTCSLGLGEAAVIMIRRKRASLQEALSSTLTPLFVVIVGGLLTLGMVLRMAFAAEWEGVQLAILLTLLTLPMSTCAHVLTHFINSQEKVILTSGMLVVTSAVATAGLLVFVGVLSLSLEGAVLAGLISAAVWFSMTVWGLKSMKVSFAPTWNSGYIGKALRYGSALQLSSLLMTLAGRLDLLLVFAIGSRAAAGHYSVALSLGQLSLYAALAMSLVSYPRLASLSHEEASALTARIFRSGLVGTGVSAAVLFLTIPLLTTFAFGDAYRPAVTPAWILVIGGVFSSTQTILCRAAAARERPTLFVISFAVSTIVMTGLDLALISDYGIVGAAWASVAGPAAGLAVCLAWYERTATFQLPLVSLIPRPEDLRYFIDFMRLWMGRLPIGGRRKDDLEP